LSVERRRFSEATTWSVEVGIQRSARRQLDRGADDDAAAASAVAVDASLIPTADAILLVTAAARRIRDLCSAGWLWLPVRWAVAEWRALL
jgi:hypothetical protein